MFPASTVMTGPPDLSTTRSPVFRPPRALIGLGVSLFTETNFLLLRTTKRSLAVATNALPSRLLVRLEEVVGHRFQAALQIPAG
jgi:hypothetical protein